MSIRIDFGDRQHTTRCINNFFYNFTIMLSESALVLCKLINVFRDYNSVIEEVME